MTQSELLDLLMVRLGYRSSVTTRNGAALEAKLKQQELEGGSFKPWFLFDDYTNGSFVTVANQEEVALPATFLGLDDDLARYLYYQDTTRQTPDQWVRIQHEDYGKVKQLAVDSVTGPPQYFSVVGSSLYLRPIPDAAYALRLPAMYAQTSFSDVNVANAWTTSAADWLLAETLRQVAIKHVKDLEMAQECAADILVAKKRVYTEHISRISTGRRVVMGD